MEDLKVKAEGPECVSLLLLFTPTIKSFNSEGGGEKKRSPCNFLKENNQTHSKNEKSTSNFVSAQCYRQRVGFCPLCVLIPAWRPDNTSATHSLHVKPCESKEVQVHHALSLQPLKETMGTLYR